MIKKERQPRSGETEVESRKQGQERRMKRKDRPMRRDGQWTKEIDGHTRGRAKKNENSSTVIDRAQTINYYPIIKSTAPLRWPHPLRSLAQVAVSRDF